MTLLKCGLSCWAAFLTVVSLCDGCADPPSSLGESFFKYVLCLMHGFNSYVFICSGRMFSAVKSLWNWDFTVHWTSGPCSGPLNNQGPVSSGAMCSAGSWICSWSVCSACWGHRSCYVLGTSLPLKNVSNPHCTLLSAHWVWRDASKQERKTLFIYMLTSISHMSKVCWQGNGSQNQTYVYEFC